MLLGALETGGTKMVCALGNEKGEIFERESFPTRDPESTFADVIGFFAGKGIEALGVSCFGPVDLNEDSPTYGYITNTPKPGWQHTSVRGRLLDALGVPVGFDTDVNGAALGEIELGAGKGLDSLVYYTIGTGLGGGFYYRGLLLHGLLHPEMGHMLLRPHPKDPSPHGFCPYHDGCLEGMACGKAMQQRWGVPARELPPDHIAWEIEAEYLAQMCVNTTVMLSPKRIVLGGGVMHQEHLFPMVRKRALEILNGYVVHPAILEHIDTYIVPPGLGNNSGAIGSLLLAVRALG